MNELDAERQIEIITDIILKVGGIENNITALMIESNKHPELENVGFSIKRDVLIARSPCLSSRIFTFEDGKVHEF